MALNRALWNGAASVVLAALAGTSGAGGTDDAPRVFLKSARFTKGSATLTVVLKNETPSRLLVWTLRQSLDYSNRAAATHSGYTAPCFDTDSPSTCSIPPYTERELDLHIPFGLRGGHPPSRVRLGVEDISAEGGSWPDAPELSFSLEDLYVGQERAGQERAWKDAEAALKECVRSSDPDPIGRTLWNLKRSESPHPLKELAAVSLRVSGGSVREADPAPCKALLAEIRVAQRAFLN